MRTGRLVHVEQMPAQPGQCLPWPDWVPAEVCEGFARSGVSLPWTHQVAMAEHADLIALGWSQNLSAGRAHTIRVALANSPIPVLLLPQSRADDQAAVTP